MLHHFCDWACLLNRYGLKIPQEVHDYRFIKLVHTLTAFTNRYLGTQVDVHYSEKSLEKMTLETLRPPYPKNYVGMNKV